MDKWIDKAINIKPANKELVQLFVKFIKLTKADLNIHTQNDGYLLDLHLFSN